MGIQAVTCLLAFCLANLALGAAVALFSLQGMSDIPGLPWLIPSLAMLFLLLQPALDWCSHRLDRAADKTALTLTSNPKPFIALMARLTDQNLTEAEPSHWTKLLFYDHPPYNERVELAHDYVSPFQRSEAI